MGESWSLDNKLKEETSWAVPSFKIHKVGSVVYNIFLIVLEHEFGLYDKNK